MILVLNAGSSSLKFSLFAERPALELELRGQVDGIGTMPRFVAKDRAGAVVGEKVCREFGVRAPFPPGKWSSDPEFPADPEFPDPES